MARLVVMVCYSKLVPLCGEKTYIYLTRKYVLFCFRDNTWKFKVKITSADDLQVIFINCILRIDMKYFNQF